MEFLFSTHQLCVICDLLSLCCPTWQLYIVLLLLLLSQFSRVRICATPQTAAHQASLPMGFSRQEYWSGVPLPSPIVLLKFKINKIKSSSPQFQQTHIKCSIIIYCQCLLVQIENIFTEKVQLNIFQTETFKSLYPRSLGNLKWNTENIGEILKIPLLCF